MTDKTKGENDAADNDESDFKSGVSRRDIMKIGAITACLLYTSPSPRDRQKSRMPSSA